MFKQHMSVSQTEVMGVAIVSLHRTFPLKYQHSAVVANRIMLIFINNEMKFISL